MAGTIGTTTVDGDANRLILQNAIYQFSGCRRQEVSVCQWAIGNDTDLLVIMVGLLSTSNKLFFVKPRKGCVASDEYNISALKALDYTPENVLFIHAFTGCNSASSTCGKKEDDSGTL